MKQFQWLAVLLSFTGLLIAQEFRATLTGRVADPAGSQIVGAVVSIRNEGTNIAYPAKTDGQGYYSAPFLPPGDYTITVESPGFKKAVRNGVQLSVTKRRSWIFRWRSAMLQVKSLLWRKRRSSMKQRLIEGE